MATQAQAPEATTSANQGADAVVDATNGEPLGEGYAGTEAQSDVFPPFDPSTFPSQLLWLAITFAALYFVLSRLALPRITRVLEDRKAIIDGDIAAADASRQKTDTAIAAYEAALASAKAKAQTIANQSRDDIQADIASKRGAVEADLSGKLAEAEARIAATKSEALTHVDEIATETAQTVVVQLLGDVPPDSVRAAVAKVSKE